MKVFPTHRDVRRARTRAVLSFFTWTSVGFFVCLAIIAIHYAFGWW
jgi:hypothetical protein